jgi:hypothetical protein
MSTTKVKHGNGNVKSIAKKFTKSQPKSVKKISTKVKAVDPVEVSRRLGRTYHHIIVYPVAVSEKTDRYAFTMFYRNAEKKFEPIITSKSFRTKGECVVSLKKFFDGWCWFSVGLHGHQNVVFDHLGEEININIKEQKVF